MFDFCFSCIADNTHTPHLKAVKVPTNFDIQSQQLEISYVFAVNRIDREVVAKMLKELKNEGIISTKRKTIVINGEV